MDTANFYDYLKDRRLAEKTISEHVKDIVRFKGWAHKTTYRISPA